MNRFPKRQRFHEGNSSAEQSFSFQESVSGRSEANHSSCSIRDAAVNRMAEIPIPHFGIQCDWESALSKNGGTCWISIRNHGQDRSTHGELKRVSSSGNPPEIVAHDPFEVVREKSSTSFITVKNQDPQYICSFVAPGSEYNDIHKTSVIALDVSEGGLGVSLCTNNQLKIWETDKGVVRRTLAGHPIDAYTCRFFPSGIVILTGGADCCLKIWSAETGDCPVTLRGHTASIQDICTVERGRNVISVSKDGTARLWDCGESKCIDTVYSCNSAINSCCLMSPTQFDLGTPLLNMSPREVLTIGKLLLIGREDRKVVGISVAARNVVFSFDLPSPINRVIQIGPNSFAAGCQGGEIFIFDIRNISQPQIIVSSTNSPILDLLIHPRSPSVKSSQGENIHCFWASKSDGSCILIIPRSEKSKQQLIQLTGPDCDPVYQIRADLDFIYTACRDGVIRKYSVNVINRLLQ